MSENLKELNNRSLFRKLYKHAQLAPNTITGSQQELDMYYDKLLEIEKELLSRMEG